MEKVTFDSWRDLLSKSNWKKLFFNWYSF